jgi:hypothetical protein
MSGRVTDKSIARSPSAYQGYRGGAAGVLASVSTPPTWMCIVWTDTIGVTGPSRAVNACLARSRAVVGHEVTLAIGS